MLRLALGTTAVVQGRFYLADLSQATFAVWAGGLFSAAGGALVLLGFLTPIASVLVGLGGAGIALSWIPAPSPNMIDTWLASLFVVIMSAAIAFLGPGAFSVDSRLFGRREIVIPHSPRPPRPR